MSNTDDRAKGAGCLCIRYNHWAAHETGCPLAHPEEPATAEGGERVAAESAERAVHYLTDNSSVNPKHDLAGVVQYIQQSEREVAGLKAQVALWSGAAGVATKERDSLRAELSEARAKLDRMTERFNEEDDRAEGWKDTADERRREVERLKRQVAAAMHEHNEARALASVHAKTIEIQRQHLAARDGKREALLDVAHEAAAMLSETNHGGLTWARSESMRVALEVARIAIPPNCSACPHPVRSAKPAQQEAEVLGECCECGSRGPVGKLCRACARKGAAEVYETNEEALAQTEQKDSKPDDTSPMPKCAVATGRGEYGGADSGIRSETGREVPCACNAATPDSAVAPGVETTGQPTPEHEASPASEVAAFEAKLVRALRKAADASDMNAPSDWLGVLADELEQGAGK